MKWFLPIFLVPLAGIGLINVLRASEKRKYILPVVTIFLLLTVSFSGYYQFIHFLPTSGTSAINERYIEESTYKTGRWMKDNLEGSAISNDVSQGMRIFATAETTHLLIGHTISNYMYGFVELNLSEFKRYPLTDEAFWFQGYEGPDLGETVWGSINKLLWAPLDFNITYVVENKRAKGNIMWGHGVIPSKLLQLAYDEKNCLYDIGKIRTWTLD